MAGSSRERKLDSQGQKKADPQGQGDKASRRDGSAASIQYLEACLPSPKSSIDNLVKYVKL
jgi:hypothetical protein